MVHEDKTNKYTVKILGEEFTITGNLNEQYVSQLQELINSIGDDISGAYPHLPRRRLWGLTLINLAHKFFQQENKNEKHLNEKEKLKREKKELKEKINSLEAEYEELSALLEEVDS